MDAVALATVPHGRPAISHQAAAVCLGSGVRVNRPEDRPDVVVADVVGVSPVFVVATAVVLDDLEMLRETLDRDIHLEMLIPNKLEQRTKLSDEYTERYADQYGGVMAPESIPKSQDIRNATDSGGTIFTLEEPSRTALRAREAYETNADELLNRL